MKERKLRTINLVIIGHIDHGKSTLIGRLLYDTGCLSEEKIEEIKKSSKSLGKDTEFAFVMDHLEEERKRGITIDTAQIFFNTKKRRFVIIDTPGHKEFLKNMMTGSSMAEKALLIIDAAEGLMEQTKRHCYILHMFGFKSVLVVINKMDLVDYSENKFREIEKLIKEYLKNLKIDVSNIVPISAKFGENIISISNRMSWFKGHSLLDMLDTCEISKIINDQLCFPVQDSYDFVKDEKIIVGRIESGIMKKGCEVYVLPENIRTAIESIEKYNNNDIQSVNPGECVGITLKNRLQLRRGQIIVDSLYPEITDTIRGNIFWISKKNCNLGESFNFKCSTQEINCEITKIFKKFDPASLELVEENSSIINEAEIAEVSIKTDRKIVVSPFSNLQVLGRFVLEKNDNVIAGGIII